MRLRSVDCRMNVRRPKRNGSIFGAESGPRIVPVID